MKLANTTGIIVRERVCNVIVDMILAKSPTPRMELWNAGLADPEHIPGYVVVTLLALVSHNMGFLARIKFLLVRRSPKRYVAFRRNKATYTKLRPFYAAIEL